MYYRMKLLCKKINLAKIRKYNAKYVTLALPLVLNYLAAYCVAINKYPKFQLIMRWLLKLVSLFTERNEAFSRLSLKGKPRR